MTSSRFRTSLALALAVTVACTLTPAPLFAASGAATFTGQVLQSDGTPRAGVQIILVNDQRQAEFESTLTADDGTFRIEGAAAGTYSVVVDTPEGAFLAAESVVLTPGVNPRLSLTLQSLAAQGTVGAGQSLGGVTWGQWTIFGAIALAAAVVIHEVTDDVEEPASPF